MESCCPRERFTLRVELSYMSMRRIVVSNSNDESKSCVVAPYSNSTKSLITFVVRGRDFSFDFPLLFPPRASSFDPFPVSPFRGNLALHFAFALFFAPSFAFSLALAFVLRFAFAPFLLPLPFSSDVVFSLPLPSATPGDSSVFDMSNLFFLCLRGVYLVVLMTSWAFTLFPEDVTFFFFAHMENAILQEVFRADVLSTPLWIFLIRAPILRLSHVLSTIFCTALSYDFLWRSSDKHWTDSRVYPFSAVCRR